MPDQASLAESFAVSAVEPVKDPRKDSGLRVNTRLRELLSRGKVEEKIALNESAGLAVVEDDFLVRVSVDVGEIKFGIEVRVDTQFSLFARLRGEKVPILLGNLEITLLVSVRGQSLGCNDFCVGELLVPVFQKDVVLLVQRDKVFGRAQSGHLGAYGSCDCCRGEDGGAARGEANGSATAADLYAPEAQEGS